MEDEKLDLNEYFGSMERYDSQKLEIYDNVANQIIDSQIQPKDIVQVLKNVCAETAWNLSLLLLYKNYINEDQEWFISDSLVKIYCVDFEKEIQSGDFAKRLNLKSVSNKRMISADEMFMVLHRRTDYMPYVKQEFTTEEDIALYEAWKEHNNTRAGQKLYNAEKKELLKLTEIIEHNINQLQNKKTI